MEHLGVDVDRVKKITLGFHDIYGPAMGGIASRIIHDD